MAKLLGRQNSILDETYERIEEAEEKRPLEFQCIIKVQAWFRAQRVRSYMAHLNYCATLIQKRWRGFRGRRQCRELLKQRVFIMKLNHYNYMATQIQKTWRGYYTRKYVSNYYSRKRYLEALQIKNEIVRSELEGYVEQQEMMDQIKKEKIDKQKQDEWAQRHHYLLSTEVLPSVYNSPFQPYPDIREFHLRNHKFAKEKKPVSKKETEFDPAWKSYNLPQLSPMPPVQAKPQGPFRDLQQVQKQRYKPFQPTLRVETGYLSLEEAREIMKEEEWVTRINDDTFVPFKQVTKTYEPQLHTTSAYGHLPYGNQFFREEFQDKFVSKPFERVVPPIPILDKLNDTYSQGQV